MVQYHRNQELVREPGGISPTSTNPEEPEEVRLVPIWREHVERLDDELLARAAPLFTPRPSDPFTAAERVHRAQTVRQRWLCASRTTPSSGTPRARR